MIGLSFIVPCLNSERTIRETLKSIFSQKLELHYEVIVVDNGSEDNTLEIVKKFPIRLFSEVQKGANHARNLGIKMSHGNYIAFVDSDVTLNPEWSRELMKYIQKNDLLAGQGKVICSPLKNPSILLEKYRCSRSTHPSNWINLVTKDNRVGFINTAACIYRADVLKKVQFFSKSIRYHEDVDLTLKVRSLPSGAIGCTSQAVAHCYYPGSLFSYLKRAFVHGYYLNLIIKKWNYKRAPLLHLERKSLLWLILDSSVKLLYLTGQVLGSFILFNFPPKEFDKECSIIKKIASLPKESNFRVYFEENELTNA